MRTYLHQSLLKLGRFCLCSLGEVCVCAHRGVFADSSRCRPLWDGGRMRGKVFKGKYFPLMKNQVEIAMGRSGKDRQKPEREKERERERGGEKEVDSGAESVYGKNNEIMRDGNTF